MSKAQTKILPSILASDLSKLAEDTNAVMAAGATAVHVDIMDGHFVPNISLGPPVVKSLRKNTDAFLDCHIMVSDPAMWIGPLADAGANSVTFHVEATDDSKPLLEEIRAKGMKAGLALKPKTDVSAVYPFMELADTILIMTVEPGFGGQKFMPAMMDKVKTLRAKYPDQDIEVDGGLNGTTVNEAAEAGANMIVAGSYVFKGDRAENIKTLKDAVSKYYPA